jgi:hypothetical protein
MQQKIALCLLCGLLAWPLAAVAQTPTVQPAVQATATATAGPATPTSGFPSATATPTSGFPSATPTEQSTATSGPTQTPFVVTATPPATPTASPPQPDGYEPNNSGGTAALINLPAQVEKLSFYPPGDSDYFRFAIKPSQAGLTLTLDTYAEIGIDTVISLIGIDGGEIASNDDLSPTEPRSHLAMTARPGAYVVAIRNHDAGRPDFKTYRLEIGLVDRPEPANEPEPGAGAAPAGGWDQYGGTNFTWEAAAEIAVGEAVEGLTFGCPAWEAGRPECAVPDFFKLMVKPGSCYTAETSVTPGIDTNLIVYSDQRDAAAPLSGNDDRAPGDFSSAAVFCPGYAGTAYLLVGQVGNVAPPPPIGQRTYGLLVKIWAPTPPLALTPTGADQAAAPAPSPPASAAPPDPPPGPADEQIPPPAVELPPTPSDVPLSGVLVEEITGRQTPAPTGLPQIVAPLSILACYDRNLNQACDIDEGIAGLTVYVAVADSGELLGQAITDQSGRAQLTIRVAEQASLTISVPTFAAVQTVSARSPQIRPIIVKTVAAIPALIP